MPNFPETLTFEASRNPTTYPIDAAGQTFPPAHFPSRLHTTSLYSLSIYHPLIFFNCRPTVSALCPPSDTFSTVAVGYFYKLPPVFHQLSPSDIFPIPAVALPRLCFNKV